MTSRLFKFISVLALIALAAALATYLWSIAALPRAGHLDAAAAGRIRASCRFHALCVVRLSDLFAGDWDTFYEFGSEVSQAEIDDALGPARIRKRDLQRLVVLTKRGRIVAAEREPAGTERPFDNEVEFGDEYHREQHMVLLSRDTVLQVASFPTTDAAGQPATFYVLRSSTPTGAP